MRAVAFMLAVMVLLSGCATHFYVKDGQDQAFKSMQECRLAHPNDSEFCVDRGQYTAASQNTVALTLQGLATAALIALTILSFGR